MATVASQTVSSSTLSSGSTVLEEASSSSSAPQRRVRWRGGEQRSSSAAEPPRMQSMPIGKTSSADDDSDGDGADLWDDSVDAGLRPSENPHSKTSRTEQVFMAAQFGCCCMMVLGTIAALLIPLMTQKLDTGLRDAVKLGDLETVSHILDDPRKKIYVDAPGPNEKTALHWAVIKGHRAVAAMLLERRADVNLGSIHGTAALHYAAREGNDPLLHQLISAGANINGTDANGWTALHWSATYGHVRVSQSLIEARVDVFAEGEGRHHKTALSLAQTNGHAPLTRIIDEAMQEAEKRQPSKDNSASMWSFR